MWKHTLIICSLLIAIAGYFFWTSMDEQHTQQVEPVPVGIEDSPRDENTVEMKPVARRVKTMMDIALTEEDLAAEDWQEWMQLVESPEFAAFLETHPSSFTDFFDFYESQGMKSYKSEVFGMVRALLAEHFPGETAEALEPGMRQELSGIYAESGIEFEQALQDFVSKEQNIAWVTEYFEGDFLEFGKWAVDVSENPVSFSSDNPSVVGNEAPQVPQNSENFLSTEGGFPEVPTLFNEAANEEPLPPSQDPVSTLENMETLIKSDPELEDEFLKQLESSLPVASKLLTVVDFERDLRERFSPQRLNTALQTLNRYGPEEGLRRLQTSDPEIATQLKHLIQREQEED